MVLEMAILFPILFLLWMGLLYVLVEIAEKGMTEAICNRSIMMCRELEQENLQSAVENLARQYCSGSGLPIRFVRAEVSVQEGGFSHTNHGVFRNGEPFMAAQELLYGAHRIYNRKCGSAESDGSHLGGRRKAADRWGRAAKVSGTARKD